MSTSHQFPLTPEFARGVYAILVEECGARPSSDPSDVAAQFLHWFTTGASTVEFRFSGSLGWGGKIFVEDRKIWVSCYKEDDTPLRTERIVRANDRLAELIEIANTPGAKLSTFLYELVSYYRTIKWQTPLRTGDRITFPAGTKVTGTGPKNPRVMTRRQTIEIDRIDNGAVIHRSLYDGEFEMRPVQITWADGRGFWCHTDLTDEIVAMNGGGSVLVDRPAFPKAVDE